MINVTIVKKNQRIITIEATGHSGYAEAGSDIVCSAISTLTETLINGLVEVVKITPKYIIDEKIPHLSVTIPNGIEKDKQMQVDALMCTTYLGIKNVANGYRKYISIKEKQND